MAVHTKSALSKLDSVQKVNVYSTKGFSKVEFEHPETAELAKLAHQNVIDNEYVVTRPFVSSNATKMSVNKKKTQ